MTLVYQCQSSRSARVRSTAHLRLDYVYNFPQVSGDSETMGSAIPASDKINLLKGFLKLFSSVF